MRALLRDGPRTARRRSRRARAAIMAVWIVAAAACGTLDVSSTATPVHTERPAPPVPPEETRDRSESDAVEVPPRAPGPGRWQVEYELPAARRRAGAWLGPLWASGPTDIFVAGRFTVVHYDGRTWQLQENGSESGIFALNGRSPTEVYAVGSFATIQRWDGTRWRVEFQDVNEGLRRGQLHSVDFEPDGGVVAASHGSLYRRASDGTWTRVGTSDASTENATSQRPVVGNETHEPCAGDAPRHSAHPACASCVEPPAELVICRDHRVWFRAEQVGRWVELPGIRDPRREQVVTVLDESPAQGFLSSDAFGGISSFDGTRWHVEYVDERRVTYRLYRVGETTYATGGGRILKRLPASERRSGTVPAPTPPGHPANER